MRVGGKEHAMNSDIPDISGVGQIAIAVEDVERATAFYRDVLGLRLLFTFPGMAFFDCGGVRLFLSRPEGPSGGTSILYYRVREIGAAASALERRGVRLEQAPHVIHRDARHELWMAFLRDSEGNLVGLMQEVEAA
jgi:methylmalonyl-CoA/ethylmalonyl-CoA epimerase